MKLNATPDNEKILADVEDKRVSTEREVFKLSEELNLPFRIYQANLPGIERDRFLFDKPVIKEMVRDALASIEIMNNGMIKYESAFGIRGEKSTWKSVLAAFVDDAQVDDRLVKYKKLLSLLGKLAREEADSAEEVRDV